MSITWSSSSRRALKTNRSATAFMFGARTAVRITFVRLAEQRRALARPRSTPPEPAEAGAMPAQHGPRLDKNDQAPPRRQPLRTQKQFEPIDHVELPALA